MVSVLNAPERQLDPPLALALRVHAELAQVTLELVRLAVSPPMMLAPVGLTVIAVGAASLLFACTALVELDGKLLLTVRPAEPLPIVAVALASTVVEELFGIAANAAFNTRRPPPRVPVEVIDRTDPDVATATTYWASPMAAVVPVQPAFWLSSYMARDSPASAAY